MELQFKIICYAVDAEVRCPEGSCLTDCFSCFHFFFQSSNYRDQNVCGGTLKWFELVGVRVIRGSSYRGSTIFSKSFTENIVGDYTSSDLWVKDDTEKSGFQRRSSCEDIMMILHDRAMIFIRTSRMILCTLQVNSVLSTVPFPLIS